MQDAILKGKDSLYQIRHCAHKLPLCLTMKFFDLVAGQSPWALSCYLKQPNAFIKNERAGPFAPITTVTSVTVMLNFKAYIHHCNQRERQRPFPPISNDTNTLYLLNLEASFLYMEWMNSGSVSGQREPEDNTPVKFCFLKGLDALHSGEGNDCVQNLIEDFTWWGHSA